MTETTMRTADRQRPTLATPPAEPGEACCAAGTLSTCCDPPSKSACCGAETEQSATAPPPTCGCR